MANSFARQDIATAPLAANSAAVVAELASQVAVRYGGVAACNLNQYNSPVITVKGTIPRKTIAFVDEQRKGYVPSTLYGATSGAHFLNAPMPDELVPPAGRDKSVELYCPDDNTITSLWHCYRDRPVSAGTKYSLTGGPLVTAVADGEIVPGWSAVWGGRIDGVSTTVGRYPNGMGVSASGLLIPEAQLTIADMVRGFCDHALTFQAYKPRASIFSYPAQRSDGWGTGEEFPMEGQRLRLPASYDLSQLASRHIICRFAAATAKTYGLILTDKAGAVAVVCEDSAMYTTRYGTNPWDTYVAGTPTYNIMAGFPWSSLEAIEKDWGKPA